MFEPHRSLWVLDVEDEAAFLDGEMQHVGAGRRDPALGVRQAEMVLVFEVRDGLGAVGLEERR